MCRSPAPGAQAGPDQYGGKLAGVARDIEHLARPLGGCPVIIASELLELGQQIIQCINQRVFLCAKSHRLIVLRNPIAERSDLFFDFDPI
jgi:hypothetical protein